MNEQGMERGASLSVCGRGFYRYPAWDPPMLSSRDASEKVVGIDELGLRLISAQPLWALISQQPDRWS